MNPVVFVAVAGCMFAIAGCEARPPVQSGAPPKAAAPKGPHGGSLVTLEPDKVTAEYMYDHATTKVRVYLDKLPAEKVKKVDMTAKVGEGEAREFPFTKAGDAWESADDSVMTYLRQGESGKVTLSVELEDGKSLITFRYLQSP